MAHSANYSSARKSFTFSCDCELRGFNATCKVIAAIAPQFGDVLREDGVNPQIFSNPAEVVNLFREKLPQIFNASGAICSFKFVTDSDENRATLDELRALYESDEIPATDKVGARVRFKIPRVKWTSNQLYALVVKACKPVKTSEVARLREEVARLREEVARKETATEESSKKSSKK